MDPLSGTPEGDRLNDFVSLQSPGRQSVLLADRENT